MIAWVEQLKRGIAGFIILGKMVFGWPPSGPEDIPEEFWGECPQCGGNDRFLNVGRAHWFVCHRHRIKWYGGENIFATWRHQSIEDWRSNARLLSGYVETDDPIYRSGRGTRRATVSSVCDVPAHQVSTEEAGGYLLEGPPEALTTDRDQGRVERDEGDL